MHRLPGFIALLLLFTLTSCGGIKVPFMGSDDDEADTVVTESSGIPKESIEMDRFGPANTDTTGISNDSNIPSSSAVVANPAPAANTSIPAPSTTAAARREPPPDPLPAANNAILRQPAAPAANSTAPAVDTAKNQVASTTAPQVPKPKAAAQPPARPKIECDAFKKICAQIVKDFIFRYRAGVVEDSVYGVVGYVEPQSKELLGKEVDLTIMFALFKGDGKANMPIPVKGLLNEPPAVRKTFQCGSQTGCCYGRVLYR